MKAIFTLFVSITFYILIPIDVKAQGIAINSDGAAPNVNAILDIQSTDMGENGLVDNSGLKQLMVLTLKLERVKYWVW